MECELCLEALVAEEMAELGCHHSVHTRCRDAVMEGEPGRACPVTVACAGGAILFNGETREQAIKRLLAVRFNEPPPVLKAVSDADFEQELRQVVSERIQRPCPGELLRYVRDEQLYYTFNGTLFKLYRGTTLLAQVMTEGSIEVREALAGIEENDLRVEFDTEGIAHVGHIMPHYDGDFTYYDEDYEAACYWGSDEWDISTTSPHAEQLKKSMLLRANSGLLDAYQKSEEHAAKQREYAINYLLSDRPIRL